MHRLLLKLLQKELNLQEQLLELLTKERACIVSLNQEQIELIGKDKDRALKKARDAADERSKVLRELADKYLLPAEKPVRLDDVSKHCEEPQVRNELSRIGGELKKTAGTVHVLNTENGALIKQSLGLIASAVSILSSSPEPDLPSYSDKGRMSANTEADLFGPGRPARSFTRSA